MTIHHPDYPSDIAPDFDWAPLLGFVQFFADISRALLTLVLAWAGWIVIKSGHGPALVHQVTEAAKHLWKAISG
jgi:energy-converting hydrogenase Eha subunit G